MRAKTTPTEAFAALSRSDPEYEARFLLRRRTAAVLKLKLTLSPLEQFIALARAR
jgi:hypothetical protein